MQQSEAKDPTTVLYTQEVVKGNFSLIQHQSQKKTKILKGFIIEYIL